MANVVKKAKRGRDLPRVTDGRISTGTRVNWAPADDSGMCKAAAELYTLDVCSGFRDDRVEYQVQVTEDEALKIATDWLTTMSRRRIDRGSK